MKKILLILSILITSICTAQTDSLSLYKKGYEQARKLNNQYKLKIETCESVVLELPKSLADSLTTLARNTIDSSIYPEN